MDTIVKKIKILSPKLEIFTTTHFENGRLHHRDEDQNIEKPYQSSFPVNIRKMHSLIMLKTR